MYCSITRSWVEDGVSQPQSAKVWEGRGGRAFAAKPWHAAELTLSFVAWAPRGLCHSSCMSNAARTAWRERILMRWVVKASGKRQDC